MNLFLFLIFIVVKSNVIDLKYCDYKMYQHISCNDFNIKLKYNSYLYNNPDIPKYSSFITTTQQYCDEYKSLCKIDQYYPKLSIIKESNFDGILKDYTQDDDDLCMIFINTNKDMIITVNYTLSYQCLDNFDNSMSLTKKILIAISILIIVSIFISCLLYIKYKNDKNIKDLKIKLKQYSDNESLDNYHYFENKLEYPIDITNKN